MGRRAVDCPAADRVGGQLVVQVRIYVNAHNWLWCFCGDLVRLLEPTVVNEAIEHHLDTAVNPARRAISVVVFV